MTRGVGCDRHRGTFQELYINPMSLSEVNEFAQSCPTLSDSMDCSPPGSFIQWDPPGKSTGVGCHCLNSYHSMGTLNLPGVSQVALVVNNLPANAGDVRDTCGLDPWVRKMLWRRTWQPTPVFLPGESHGERSLAGYIPWGHKELDTATNTFTFMERITPKAASSLVFLSS